MLRSTPEKSKFQEDDCPEFSVHDYAFKMLIADIHEDLTVCQQAFLMTQLLQMCLDYLPADIPNTVYNNVVDDIVFLSSLLGAWVTK
jgi:hypothetical protein